MSEITVVVGYSDKETQGFVSEFLETFEYDVLETTQYGFDCVEAINEYLPDIVICDAFMYDLNACQIIETVKKLGKADPAFVVVSRSNVSGLAELSSCRDISFYSLVPFDYLNFHKKLIYLSEQRKKLRDVAEHDMAPAGDKDSAAGGSVQYPDSYENYRIVNCIRENMRLLGIPTKMRGYRYIFDAVMLAMHDGEMLYSLTKQLYPRLAKLNDTSVASVERAIRVAVRRSWERGDYSVVTEMFGYSVEAGNNPTNGQFISMLTEHVKNELGIL